MITINKYSKKIVSFIEVNLLNGSAVIRLPLLFEKFLYFPIS